MACIYLQIIAAPRTRLRPIGARLTATLNAQPLALPPVRGTRKGSINAELAVEDRLPPAAKGTWSRPRLGQAVAVTETAEAAEEIPPTSREFALSGAYRRFLRTHL